MNASLTAASELISAQQAVEICRQYYGLGADDAVRLSGEKDSNYRINVGVDEYLLKVINPGEEEGLSSMHTAALLHVEQRDPALPVQRVISTVDGRPDFRMSVAENDVRTVRLVTFTKGLMQRATPQTVHQRYNAGAMLARLQLALSDFNHPWDSHPIAWDLKNASSLRSLFSEIPDAEHTAEFNRWIDVFDAEIQPAIPSLPSQVVHNDLNSDNIVVDPSDTDVISGIIDFGDMVRTPAMFDVAVGAAYQLTDAEDPLGAACDFLQGFHSVKPLLPLEVDLMFRTIMVRMIMRISLTEWRATRFPENREYILRNTPKVWRVFHYLSDHSDRQATNQIAKTLQS